MQQLGGKGFPTGCSKRVKLLLAGLETPFISLLLNNFTVVLHAVALKVVLSIITFILSCIYNCGPTAVDPGKHTIVESHCTGHLCQNITLYEWHLFKLNLTDGSHYWKEVTDLDKRIETPRNNSNIFLRGGGECSLEKNTDYKINASIEVNGKKNYSSLNETTFKTISLLSVPNNTCKVTPSVGVAYSTNFMVDCAGWQDQSEHRTFSYR